MEVLIKFCFNSSDKELIETIRYGDIQTNNCEKIGLPFTKTSIKLTINSLLDTWCIMCFRQFTGIPLKPSSANSKPLFVML